MGHAGVPECCVALVASMSSNKKWKTKKLAGHKKSKKPNNTTKAKGVIAKGNSQKMEN